MDGFELRTSGGIKTLGKAATPKFKAKKKPSRGMASNREGPITEQV